MTMNEIADWLLFASFPAPPIFMLLYLRSRWTQTMPGRALMGLAGALVVVLTVAILTVMFGMSYPGRGAIRMAGYGMLFVSMWGLVAVLWKIQKDSPKSRRHADTPSCPPDDGPRV